MKPVKKLLGEEISPLTLKSDTNEILEKINAPKEATEALNKRIRTSKKVSEEDKLKLIEENVMRILGHHMKDSYVIKTKEQLVEYFDKVLENHLIVIDTETNNSLDPLTCKIMGACLFTPGLKQTYVPINHVDRKTGERLSWQLTEEDLHEQFSRILEGVKVIYHNAKFDYKVIYCTCGVKLPIDEDTMIGARLLNENEPAGLKFQYVDKINPEQEKYSLENLFEHEKYEIFDPELFSMYASTDAMMTYQLYEYQLKEFQKPGNEKVYALYREVEVPIIKVVAEMELRGVELDLDYTERLKVKYHSKLEKLDAELKKELDLLKPQIEAWKDKAMKKASKPGAAYHPSFDDNDWKLIKEGEEYQKWLDRNKVGKPDQKVEELHPEFTEKDCEQNFNYYCDFYKNPKTGKIYRAHSYSKQIWEEKKVKTIYEKLEEDINVASPSQLAILLYDVLKVPPVNKDTPRGTGADILESILKKQDIPFLRVLIERKKVQKIVEAFVDSLPEKVCPKTGRIHCSFNQLGADTGRFSCTNPNLQQIPAKNREIRMMFKAGSSYSTLETESNTFTLTKYQNVLTQRGYVKPCFLNKESDVVIDGDGNQMKVKNVVILEDKTLITVEE